MKTSRSAAVGDEMSVLFLIQSTVLPIRVPVAVTWLPPVLTPVRPLLAFSPFIASTTE